MWINQKLVLLFIFKDIKITWLKLTWLTPMSPLNKLLELGQSGKNFIDRFTIRFSRYTTSFSLCCLFTYGFLCQQILYHRTQLDDFLCECYHKAMKLGCGLWFVLGITNDLPGLSEPCIEELFHYFHFMYTLPVIHIWLVLELSLNWLNLLRWWVLLKVLILLGNWCLISTHCWVVLYWIDLILKIPIGVRLLLEIVHLKKLLFYSI